ncbi:g8774 [Coccomyxa elongata]
MSGLLASQPLLPALGLASVVILVLSLVVLVFRHRSSKPGGGRKTSVVVNGEANTEDTRQKALILFGTQTGTAERFSKQLKSELAARYGDGNRYEVLDMEEFKAEELHKEKLVFFMMATYGDGEPTDNAADFYGWLVKASSDADKGIGNGKLLEGVSFGVFGLGNKQYEHFCAVGKRVHKALVNLGANALVHRGDGDDDEDIEADFESWRTELYAALDKSDVLAKSSAGDPGVTQIVAAAETVASYQVEILTGADAAGAEDVTTDAPVSGNGTSIHSPFLARISALRELHTPQSDRSCVHVELDVSGSDIAYEAGDHVGIMPENGREVVERAAAALGYPQETVFRLRVPEGNPQMMAQPFAGGAITLRAALARYADLLSPVSKPALQALSAFANGEDAARLHWLLSPEGAAEYKAWHQQSRCLLEVLEEFPNIKPPLGAFFGSIMQRLQTRFYSISSSPLQHPKSIHVTCAVVLETTVTGRVHEGIASYFLKQKAPGARVPVFVRHSSFRLPRDPAAPIIMVGPGTGLAPFRGFLQERAALIAKGTKLGPAYLFFGCRKRAQDYIYQEELEAFARDGTLTKLFVAFSRDGTIKDYVQHHMAREADLIAPVLRDDGPGYFYVCGDAKHMAKDVARTAVAIVEKAEGVSTGQAEAILKRMSDAGRIQKDVW